MLTGILKKTSMVLNTVPTPQRRPRFSSRGKFTRTFKDDIQRENEALLEECLLPYLFETPSDKAIKMEIIAYMPYPKTGKSPVFGVGYSTKAFKNKIKECKELFVHVKTPDSDNIAKQVLDAFTRVGFWLDDGQVFSLTVNKIYSDKPRLEILMTEYEYTAL